VKRTITVALAGNPNCGKSTVFNALTGSRQHVGNWPGKTVDKKTGTCSLKGQEVTIVDLPGTYSLSAFSIEEMIARDFLIEGKPDVVIDVLDSANLERNLYLALQILEIGVPVVLALNMTDLAEQRGLRIDVERLSLGLYNTPVVCTVASKNEGIEALLETALDTANAGMKDEGESQNDRT